MPVTLRVLLTDLRRVAAEGRTPGVAVRAREAAVEVLLLVRVTLRVPDAVVLDEAVLDALDALALWAAVFDVPAFAATDVRVRGCVGVARERAAHSSETLRIASARQTVIRVLQCNFRTISELLRGWLLRLFSTRFVRRSVLVILEQFPCLIFRQFLQFSCYFFKPVAATKVHLEGCERPLQTRPSRRIRLPTRPPGYSPEVLSPGVSNLLTLFYGSSGTDWERYTNPILPN